MQNETCCDKNKCCNNTMGADGKCCDKSLCCSSCDKNVCCKAGIKCISWGGISAAALLAVGLSFLLNLLAAGLGLSTLDFTPEGVASVAIAGYVGMLCGVIAIMFFAGWVAGRIARKYTFNKNHGALHGIIAWSLAIVIMVLLATQTTQFVATNLDLMSERRIATVRLFDHATNGMNSNPVFANSTNNNTVAQRANVDTRVTMDQATATDLLTLSTFLMFGLFFAGAVASALGGHCGSKCGCCCKKTDDNKPAYTSDR